MKKNSPVIQLIIFTILIFLQSRLFHAEPAFYRFLPDFSFIAFFFFAINNGKRGGYLLGFICGLITFPFLMPDTVLGLHAFIYTLIGFIAGNLKGRLIVDPVILPLIYLAGAFLLRLIILTFFSIMPEIEITLASLSSIGIQAASTIAAAPILYNFFSLIRLINLNERVQN